MMDAVERIIDSVLRHHYLEDNYDIGPEEFASLVRVTRPDIERILAESGEVSY